MAGYDITGWLEQPGEKMHLGPDFPQQINLPLIK